MKNYLIYLISMFTIISSCGKKEKITIAIQPFGDIDHEYISIVKQGLDSIYDTEAIVLKTLGLPKHTYVNIKSPRYRADKLIHYLKDHKPDSVDYVIGLTERDISTSKKDKHGKVKEPNSKYEDWGIFGLGYRTGPSCIISTFRLKHKSESISYDRIRKVAAHEIGHNLGLPHCTSGKNCLMKDAVESVKTVDNEKFGLCGSCKSKIK